jgi:hypothetical protein
MTGRIPTKATKHLKSLLVTRYLIGKKEAGSEKVKVSKTSTNSIFQNSDKSHTRSDGKTPRISPRHS